MSKIDVTKIIKDSLQELQKIGEEKEFPGENQDSKLIFPKKRKTTERRRSEKEAVFLFVRELEKSEGKLYYSVETPTQKKYKFSENNKPCDPQILPEKVRGGTSARFDVTLYLKRGANEISKKHIEFKFGNNDTCRKDFLKLLCDDDNQSVINYFINIIESKDIIKSKDTIESLKEKFKTSIEYILKKYKDQKHSKLRIFVFILDYSEGNNFFEFEYEILETDPLTVDIIEVKSEKIPTT